MEEPEQEARRLKSVAEAKYKDSNVKSALKYAKRAERLSPSLEGISSMVTALRIIRTASQSPNPDWRKEYDMKLRIKIQDEKIKESGVGGLGSSMVVESDTFWTACSTCRPLHQFERRYLGHNLVCPSCKKSFKALEVENGENFKVRTSERLRKVSLASKGGMSSEGLVRRVSDSGEINGSTGGKGKGGVLQRKGEVGTGDLDSQVSAGKKKSVVWEKKGEVGTGSLGNQANGSDAVEPSGWRLRRRMSSVGEVMESDEMMTLAEMKQMAQKEKMKMKMKLKLKDKNDERDKKEKRERLRHDKLKKGKNLDVEKRSVSKKDLERRSFEKGQVWAIYDDDDGMPGHYGLIDEVVSVKPFEVKMSWLDLQNNGYEWLAFLEKMGFHVSCGSETAFDAEGRNLSSKDKRCCDIVVFLTAYSEMHGMSIGYLEKVDGFKTVFKRREIGSHAVRLLENSDVRLASHQIPSRKLSGDEAPNLFKDCWELDPASLPPDLLTFGSGRLV
ncbi:hypothetical protein C1H46_008496 [Malus baccata]|uniref:DUF3444 domain-containing protein n=1 Tax=Malus baccata TaxID=106549 RepID=A0A540N5I4_MALBA|nr:hypothetical protein C1H46_008496 [Malus baccata]